MTIMRKKETSLLYILSSVSVSARIKSKGDAFMWKTLATTILVTVLAEVAKELTLFQETSKPTLGRKG